MITDDGMFGPFAFDHEPTDAEALALFDAPSNGLPSADQRNQRTIYSKVPIGDGRYQVQFRCWNEWPDPQPDP